jgi:hypothetical protein
MATTTNYGWTTPDDTALVKDGASAIRTLGSSVDTTTKALNPETTLGDIAYRSSSANVKTRLGIGTTGQVLTVAGGVPSWATPAGGGGKVLQVVSTAKTDTFVQSGSTSFTDVTGLSVSITPTLNTSKILVLVSLSASAAVAGNSSAARLVRDSTDIFIGDAASNRTRVTIAILQGETQYAYSNHISFLDSPATTSATTYKVQVLGLPSGGSTFVNRGQTDTDSSTFTRSASSITVMEIGA